MRYPLSCSCVEHGAPAPRRLNGAEAVVIIVVVGLTTALATLAGLTGVEVLQLVAGGCFLAGSTIVLSTRFSLRSVRAVIRAAATSV